MHRVLHILLVAFSGCAGGPSFEERQRLKQEWYAASNALEEKAYRLSIQYANGSESAESIAHAVCSDCTPEIYRFVETYVARAKAETSMISKRELWQWERDKRIEITDTIWRKSVSYVVKERSGGKEQREQ